MVLDIFYILFAILLRLVKRVVPFTKIERLLLDRYLDLQISPDRIESSPIYILKDKEAINKLFADN